MFQIFSKNFWQPETFREDNSRESICFSGSKDVARIIDEIRWRDIKGLVIDFERHTIEYPAEIREDVRAALKAA